MYTRAEIEKLLRPLSFVTQNARQVGGHFARQPDGACPIRTGQAEAMAFDQASARGRALEPRADARKPAFSEDNLRGLVLNPDARQDLNRARQCEGCVDHRYRRLSRKSLTPGLGRQRKAERQALRATQFEADRPNGVSSFP